MSFKKYYKKLIATVTAISMMLAATGCGESTSWIVKYGDKKVNAGVYIFYQTQAYNEAVTRLQEEDENLDVSDEKLLKSKKIEELSFTDWINEQATQNVRIHLAVEKRFKELGLEMDEESKANINSEADMMWAYYSDVYEQNGIGKESLKAIMKFNYMQDEVFNACYNTGGEFEYSDNDIKSYLEGNYARTKMIKLHLTDGNSEELDDEGKNKIKEMAQEYLERAEAGESFDDLIKEYQEYRDKLVEDAANAEETTDDGTETSETTEADDTGIENSTEDSEGIENEEGSEETAVTEGEEETQEAEPAENEEETENAQDNAGAEENDVEGEEHLQEENADGEQSDNDVEEGDSSAENSEEETSDENEENSEENVETEENEETEETDPYANESLIYKGSEDEGYNPSKVVNQAIFDECSVNGKPVVVEDEENLFIYVIQRLDILERTDLLEGDTRISILWEILDEEFKQKALEWVTDKDIKKNNRAYKRYDPFNIKFE